MSLFALALATLATLVWLVLADAVAARLAPRRTIESVGPSSARSRSRPIDATQWADVLAAIAADTRSGTSLTAALAAAGTVGERPVADARDTAVVQHAIATARALGGPPAPTLDAAAAVLRERAAHRAEAAVHSAQARLSARVLTGVPLVFTLWSALTSPTFRAALVSPIGVTSATLGAVLNLCGWGWMRRSIRRAVP